MIRASSSKTSTCSSRANPQEARLIVEATDFGYGPAHALLAAFGEWDDAPPLTIVSSGNAARFLHEQLPGAGMIELDCASPESWSAFLELTATSKLAVTMSRQLAECASRAGRRVGLIDQLHWMWHDRPSWGRPPAFHIIQAYFGQANASQIQGATVVGPIVSDVFRRIAANSGESGTAVIGFGGMSMLGRRDAADSYATWILAKALPVLLKEAAFKRVTVIGGREQLATLVPATWRCDPRLEVITACPPAEYAERLRTSSHQILTPGLATIYECAELGLEPLLGPGYNKSMLLQLDDLARMGYRETARWPWHCKQRRPAAARAPAIGRARAAQPKDRADDRADGGGEVAHRPRPKVRGGRLPTRAAQAGNRRIPRCHRNYPCSDSHSTGLFGLR